MANRLQAGERIDREAILIMYPERGFDSAATLASIRTTWTCAILLGQTGVSNDAMDQVRKYDLEIKTDAEGMTITVRKPV